jgi:hypothetical protein
MTDPALWVAIAGVISAAASLAAVLKHATGPKHQ